MNLNRLDEIFRENRSALVLYALQWTERAEDVVQEIFLQFALKYEQIEHPKAWLYRAVKNRAINSLRDDNTRKRLERESAQRIADRLQSDVDPPLADPEEIAKALGDLKPDHREIVILKIWSNMTFEEISKTTGISGTTAFRMYRESLLQLKKWLEKLHV